MFSELETHHELSTGDVRFDPIDNIPKRYPIAVMTLAADLQQPHQQIPFFVVLTIDNFLLLGFTRELKRNMF